MDPTAEPMDLPDGYGTATTTTTMGWAAVRQRLEQAPRYWLVTARRDGRAHVVPVDGLWLDDAWWYGGSPATLHQRNLERDQRVVAASTAKYGYGPPPGAYAAGSGCCARNGPGPGARSRPTSPASGSPECSAAWPPGQAAGGLGLGVGAAAQGLEPGGGALQEGVPVQPARAPLARGEVVAQLALAAGQLPGHGQPLGRLDGAGPGPDRLAPAALQLLPGAEAEPGSGPGHGEGAAVALQAAQAGGCRRPDLGRVDAWPPAALQQGLADLGDAGVGLDG